MNGHMRRASWAASAALAWGIGVTAAPAADLGGNCCADLEERVAELEATTARKGNRKVSLTVSGWVNEAVFFWDDGTEQNTYVGTNELEQSRFRFSGDAKIAAGWNAGYILEVGVNGAGSKAFADDNTGASAVTLRKSAWYVKSKDLGKVAVGKFDPATYHLIDNVDMLLTRNVSDYEASGVYISSFKIRTGGAFVPLGAAFTKWTDLMSGFNNGTAGQVGLRNVVRYDTPEIKGFTMSASWGEDDQWDVASRYAGTLGDFKLSASLGYAESTDKGVNAGICSVGTGHCSWWGAGALVQHTPTGLFVYGGYGVNEIQLTAAQVALGRDPTSTTWYVQGGIEKKWLPLGKTNIFGEYRTDDAGLTKGAASANIAMWAAGVAQNIESADFTLYAMYRHYDGDCVALGGGAPVALDAFQEVITGGKINF